MPRNHPLLTCVSITICDDIFQDVTTKKYALWGTFNVIVSNAVPVVHPRISLFVTITNGRGTKNLGISIEKARTGESIVEMSGPMQFKSPLDIVDIPISLANVGFDEFGKYWVCVKDNGRPLAQRPFNVTKMKKNKRKETGS
jgi:hypothetical protein